MLKEKELKFASIFSRDVEPIQLQVLSNFKKFRRKIREKFKEIWKKFIFLERS
jgi:hypothetical protein